MRNGLLFQLMNAGLAPVTLMRDGDVRLVGCMLQPRKQIRVPNAMCQRDCHAFCSLCNRQSLICTTRAGAQYYPGESLAGEDDYVKVCRRRDSACWHCTTYS